MRRDQVLKMAKLDGFKRRHLTEETKKAAAGLVSQDKLNEALWEGKRLREEIENKHGVWEAKEREEKIRGKLKRALSWGDVLTEPENVQLIRDLVTAKEVFFKSIEAAEKEIEETEL